jgi:cobalamin biosynthesis Mg chelatase CobN
MRQARESRHHIFTFAALAALIVCAAIAPAIAAGEPGGDEYTLDVPGQGNTPVGGGGGSGGSGGSGDASSSVSPATVPESTEGGGSSTDDSATPASGSNGGGGKHGGDKGENVTNASGGSGGGEKPNSDLVSGDTASTSVDSSGSDDGGVPVFLIVIAVLAAACVGFAIWRMRRSDDTDGDQAPDQAPTREVDPGTQSP